MRAIITAKGQQFHISLPRGTAAVPQISEWVGWKRTPHGCYFAPLWASSALAVKAGPGIQVTWSPEAAQARDDLYGRLHRAKAFLAGGNLPLTLTSPAARAPRPHQWEAVHAGREMGWKLLLHDDMGLGKTSEALWMAYDSLVRRVLVVCPQAVKFNWEAEVDATLEGWPTTVIDGDAKRRAQHFAHLWCMTSDGEGSGGTNVCVINYDLLRHLTEEQRAALGKWLSVNGMLILDEAHYLKNRKSGRTRHVQALSRFPKFQLQLTGTPIMNQADDLYSQIEICRPGTWSSYHDFAKRHLVMRSITFGGKRPVMKVVGTKNLDQLNAVLDTMRIRRKKADVLNLPEKTFTYPDLQLDDDTRHVYDAMKDFARIELGKLEPGMNVFDPRAKSGVEAAMRCEQIAQGFIGGIPDPVMGRLRTSALHGAEKIPGRPNELIFPRSTKMVWLLEMIDSVLAQGGQPFVLSRFNAPIVWLMKHLNTNGTPTSILMGDISAQDRFAAVELFQAGTKKVMLCQAKIAVGFNLTRSQDVLAYGRDWSPAVNAQGYDRTHRMGQKGTVNVQIPIVRKTIEVMTDRKLRAKSADADQALKAVTIQELMQAL